MDSNFLKKSLLLLSLAILPIFVAVFFRALSTEPTLPALTEKAEKAGEAMLSDLRSIPVKEIKEEEESYIIEEDGKDGIDISFASSSVIASESSSAAIQDSGSEKEKPKTTLSLPKDYGKPIEVRLDDQRVVLITDLAGNGDYSASILADESPSSRGSEATAAIQEKSIAKDWIATLFRQNGTARNDEASLGGSTSKYLTYTSPDERKTHLYAYQKDQASGEKLLKSWTLYQYGLGKETESYKIENAKIKIDEDGNADVFFFGQSDVQSEQAKADVDPSLMDRAQRFLQEETGNDIMNDTNRTPDFTIPRPTYFTKDGTEKESDWTWDETTKTLSVALTENPDAYPIALDPTLAFTAPGSTSGGGVITGEGGSFGGAMVSGDFNADGRMDLVVGAYGYSSNAGRVYLFYNDGLNYLTSSAFADTIVTSEAASNYFGISLAAGDWNADGKTDLAVGAQGYSSDTGRVYIFYNDESYPTAAVSADVIITGEATGDSFGNNSLAAGDFNADGKIDLAVGAYGYSTFTGRAYIFYNDGSYPTAAGSADAKITGQASNNYFGYSLAAGDFNRDGKMDLATGADGYSSEAGRAYIFYNDGSYPTAAASADVIVDGEGSGILPFGYTVFSGDMNADGETDLIVAATFYNAIDMGRVYIFYNDGSYPTAAASADVIIGSGGLTNQFGFSLEVGDFNGDGRDDLAVTDTDISSAGRAYIFYNDGSYPTAAASADVIIQGEATSNSFGYSLAAGDFNTDGKTDLVVGASGYASGAGKVYLFYSQNGQVNTNRNIVGEGTGSYFGSAMAAGDLNVDGKVDLVVSAFGYPSSGWTGRVYIFYNDGSYPTAAANADVFITGESAGMLGNAFSIADLNADGKTDLAVGSREWSSNTGKTYIFYADGTNDFGTAACSGTPASCLAANADVIISGQGTSNYFGRSLAVGDFNIDGKTDLAVGAQNYNSGAGRAYIFYNDGTYPSLAANADVFISGETGSLFGWILTAGDFDANGTTDLAAGGYGYDVGSNTNEGRAYVFYADGTSNFGTASCSGTPAACSAANADAIMTGAAGDQFGYSLAAGDLNADGKTDLVVGAWAYSSNTGRAHVFYSGSITTENSSGADITINGESGTFGNSLATGDFNADGRADLLVGAVAYTTNTGRLYIFHNDGSIPTAAASADVTITGDATNSYLGYYNFAVGDLNADGRTDFIASNYTYSTNTGRIFFYETRENFAWKLQPVSGLRTSPNFSGQEMKITGEVGTTGAFGNAFAAGDFNQDGKTDLAVGASVYNSDTGRVYLFYNDGSVSPGATSADMILTGEATNNNFGFSLVAGDFNADGRTDLVVGARRYSTYTGRAYIFYNDGSIPETAASADVKITGEGTNNGFTDALCAGDFNADGKTDLAVGSSTYSSNTGRAYVFYSGSIITEAATGADVIITGEGGYFGGSIIAGDFNVDGEIDLVVSAGFISSSAGRVYIFYNDGSYPTAAASAEVFITGESSSYFGVSLASGDFNADGKTDLVSGASGYSTFTGRAYIFYADGTNNFGTATCSGTPAACSAANADVFITGEASSGFGNYLISGDFNTDNKTDFVVSTSTYSSSTGRAYLFYNDGSIPTTAATADLILQGEAMNNYYGAALAAGDFNADGKTDLVVGAYGYGSNKGRAYLYTFNDGVITGEASSQLGYSMVSGDFNADGRMDLAVGGNSYSTSTGRVYLFWNDGLAYPTGSASADVIITGEASSYFGQSLASGDVNADGKTDLIATAANMTTNTGRVYIFYNGSIVTEAASSADVLITGEGTGNYFGYSSVTGDFNADGKTDLAVGAYGYSGYLGRAYVFYADGTSNFGTATCSGTPAACSAANADAIISGEAVSSFGISITSGDFNADGKIDLAVGGYDYSSQTGRAYLFYNGSIVTEAASSADVLITGEGTSNFFAVAMASGDFNADGKTDLVVGSHYHSSYTGRAYVFYADGTSNFGTATCSGTPAACSAANADVIISGESTNSYFGFSFASGDFNADGKIDLAVGAYYYSSYTGRAYVFYNDGSFPLSASSADIIMTGNTSEQYGRTIVSADFNQDGKADIAVGASGYSSNTGRAYVVITEARSVFDDQVMRVKGSLRTKGGFKAR